MHRLIHLWQCLWVDLAPFSAVLVNCQLYRLNNITCFFLVTKVLLQHPSVLTVPFGDTDHVINWLGITGNVSKPEIEHPKRPVEGLNCKRGEVSGARLWGFLKEICKTPEVFFKNCFIHNYCPLVFIAKSGKNITPPSIKTTEKRELFTLCDSALAEVVELLKPEVVVGVGKFAEERARKTLKETETKICGIMHPSPASPAANSGWATIALKQLRELGLIDIMT